MPENTSEKYDYRELLSALGWFSNAKGNVWYPSGTKLNRKGVSIDCNRIKIFDSNRYFKPFEFRFPADRNGHRIPHFERYKCYATFYELLAAHLDPLQVACAEAALDHQQRDLSESKNAETVNAR